MLKRKPANEYHQMLPHYESKYEPGRNNLGFQTAKEFSMEADEKMVEKSRIDRIYRAIEIETMIYPKHEDIPENKGLSIYGFKHIKTDKIDNFILIGCESGELLEKDKLFKFWSNKFINEEMQKNSR